MKVGIIGIQRENAQSIKRRIFNILLGRLSRSKGRRETSHLSDPAVKTFYFEISTSELSFDDIFHSAFGTPARYVMAVFSRLSSLGGDDNYLIFNPFFRISEPDANTVTGVAKKILTAGSITVFSDRNNMPIAYLLPSTILHTEAHYFSLLSTIEAYLDSKLLRNIFSMPSNVMRIESISLKTEANNLFYFNKHYKRIFVWTAESALNALYSLSGGGIDNEKAMTIGEKESSILKSRRDSIPFTAIMPHHAGDVLFLALASTRVETHFKKVVLSHWYVDIMKECSTMESVVMELLPPIREGNAKSEDEYFEDVAEKFTDDDYKNNFFYFCRPTRDYQISAFHLIDHFAFALGADLHSKEELVSKVPPEKIFLRQGTDRKKIILHFEGGWPLKVYPRKMQKVLIEKLLSKGFELTVLTSEEGELGKYETVKFKNLVQYKELLASHNLLIGMDSFPVHYSAHVVGLPTICLFGPTKPVNSNAVVSRHYRFLEKDLGCAGCGGFKMCHRNGRRDCGNFPEPEQVCITAERMLNDLYSEGVQ